MSIDGARQAAQVLRIYLATMGVPDRHQQTSALASLIYSQRLNDPPIYPGDPHAIDTVCDRFGDILRDHLDLAAVIVAMAAADRGTSPADLLDQAVQRHLGGYDPPSAGTDDTEPR